MPTVIHAQAKQSIVADVLEDVVPLQLILGLHPAHVAVYLRVDCTVATIEKANVASEGPFSDAPCILLHFSMPRCCVRQMRVEM